MMKNKEMDPATSRRTHLVIKITLTYGVLFAILLMATAPVAQAQIIKPVIPPRQLEIPQLTAGAIQYEKGKPDRQDAGEGLRVLQDPSLLQLRGIPGILEGAGKMPQVVTDMLVLHARTLPAEELDSYIVSPKLMQEWLKSQQLSPELVEKVRKAAADDGKKKKKGCSRRHISTGCVKNEVEQSIDDLTKAWRDAWKAIVDEWGRALKCFEEDTLTLANIPVKVSAAREFPLNFGTPAGLSGKGQSGSVRGGVTVGVAVNGDFRTTVKMSYIPCLPFVIRPKSIEANGTMAVDESFTASVNAAGPFNRSLPVPPNGGIQLPIAVLPIALGDVPIAMLDISVYLDGTIDVSGEGTLDGGVKLQSTQKSAFGFKCDGHNCDITSGLKSEPVTAVESVKLDGRIKIKPVIYAALQLSLNYNLLSARAGLQPFLLGEVYGCGAASATQNTAGASSSEQSYALVSDLDWGIELRAEAVVAGQRVAEKKWPVPPVSGHIYFKDLAQSTGLKPIVAGSLQPSAGQSVPYTVTMPACYPYPDQIDYRVTWTGGATASTGTPNPGVTRGVPIGLPGNIPGRTAPTSASSSCTLPKCSAAPLAITSFNLVWPTPGDYTLTVTPVGDRHGRTFDSSRATQVNIQVRP